jgi:hypothetical protein
MQSWKSPGRKFRGKIKAGFEFAASLADRYVPYTNQELETTSGAVELFDGDVPADMYGQQQQPLSYANPRPNVELLEDVIYLPSGQAWSKDRLIRRASIRAPSIRELLAKPAVPKTESIAEAILLEGVTPYTYGDWLGDQILMLCQSPTVQHPVLVPEFLARKSYVKRDLDSLGRDWRAVDQPVHIRRASVLRKVRPSYYWTASDVAAYRARLNINPPETKPGSLIYLSRENVVSEVLDRSLPSALVSDLVRQAGGIVVDTAKASPAMFQELAPYAETVICDQGSAISGVLYWQTRRVLEITTDGWWHNFGLFVSRAAGVKTFEIIVTDRHSEAEIAARVNDFIGVSRADVGTR